MNENEISRIQINDIIYNLSDVDTKNSLQETLKEIEKLKNYTAFEVFAHNYDINRDSQELMLGGDHIVKWQDIPACMTHRVCIRTGMIEHETSDVVVDWGDGSISTIANGEYLEKTTSVEDKESDYVLEHTYSLNGKYIVKIFGKQYYSICTPSDPNNEEHKYNLICRILDNDLPLAPCVTNISSLCAYAIRLFSVHVPSYFDLSRIVNIGGIFRGCKNLQSVKGLKNQFINVAAANQIFVDCYSLTELEFTMPTSVSRGFSNEMFRNCIEYAGKIEDLIPSGGFVGGILGANYLFSECRKLTGTVPAEQFWNNPNVTWINTSTAFLDCPEEIRKQVPASWGGLADDSIIIKNNDNLELVYAPGSGTIRSIDVKAGKRYFMGDWYEGQQNVTDEQLNTIGNLDVLEILSVENSPNESEIIFGFRDSTPTIYCPKGLNWIGDLTLQKSKTYIINIKNNEAIIAEYHKVDTKNNSYPVQGEL